MPPCPYLDLVAATGGFDRAAVLAMAWRRTLRERAGYARDGTTPPPLREIFAAQLHLTWDWARAVRRGLDWGTLHDPRRAVEAMREAA